MMRGVFVAATAAAIAMVLFVGCSANGQTQQPVSSPQPAGATSAAVEPSADADSSEAYRLVVKELIESQPYKEMESAVNAFLEDNPSIRCQNGDYASLRRDADNLRELAGKLPKYDGDNVTANLAYQHAERYAQAAVSSADAFADARTVEDVESATVLFGAGYDEMKELTRIVVKLREENE